MNGNINSWCPRYETKTNFPLACLNVHCPPSQVQGGEVQYSSSLAPLHSHLYPLSPSNPPTLPTPCPSLVSLILPPHHLPLTKTSVWQHHVFQISKGFVCFVTVLILVFVQSKQTEIDVFKLASLNRMKIIHMTLLDFLLLIMAPFWGWI